MCRFQVLLHMGCSAQNDFLWEPTPPREESQTKVFCTFGRNRDQGTILGAKVPDKTLLRKGSKLAKVREESPQINFISPQEGGCEARGPILGNPTDRLLPAGGGTAAKRKGKKPQFSFDRRVSANLPEKKVRNIPSSEAASKEGTAQKTLQ